MGQLFLLQSATSGIAKFDGKFLLQSGTGIIKSSNPYKVGQFNMKNIFILCSLFHEPLGKPLAERYEKRGKN